MPLIVTHTIDSIKVVFFFFFLIKQSIKSTSLSCTLILEILNEKNTFKLMASDKVTGSNVIRGAAE